MCTSQCLGCYRLYGNLLLYFLAFLLLLRGGIFPIILSSLLRVLVKLGGGLPTYKYKTSHPCAGMNTENRTMNTDYILYLLNPNYKTPHLGTSEGMEGLINDRIALMELSEIMQANLKLTDNALAQCIELGQSLQYGDYKITHAKPRSTFNKAAFEAKYPADQYPHLYNRKVVPIPAADLKKAISGTEYNKFLETSTRGGSINVKHQE